MLLESSITLNILLIIYIIYNYFKNRKLEFKIRLDNTHYPSRPNDFNYPSMSNNIRSRGRSRSGSP
jgi:hypothetical protein